jgi:hypothetical protein
MFLLGGTRDETHALHASANCANSCPTPPNACSPPNSANWKRTASSTAASTHSPAQDRIFHLRKRRNSQANHRRHVALASIFYADLRLQQDCNFYLVVFRYFS